MPFIMYVIPVRLPVRLSANSVGVLGKWLEGRGRTDDAAGELNDRILSTLNAATKIVDEPEIEFTSAERALLLDVLEDHEAEAKADSGLRQLREALVDLEERGRRPMDTS